VKGQLSQIDDRAWNGCGFSKGRTQRIADREPLVAGQRCRVLRMRNRTEPEPTFRSRPLDECHRREPVRLQDAVEVTVKPARRSRQHKRIANPRVLHILRGARTAEPVQPAAASQK